VTISYAAVAVSRQVGGRQGVSDNWLETIGFTHLVGDSLLTSGDNMIGWRHMTTRR